MTQQLEVDTDNILEVKDLCISFHTPSGEVKAVRGLDFSLARGEVLGLVGESGSGKSVTSLALMGLLREEAGISIGGQVSFQPPGSKTLSLLEQSEKDMSSLRGGSMSMVFQEPSRALNPVLRCGRQLSETLIRHMGYSRESARKESLQWLEKVRLPETERIYQAYPHQLSGGQKQRVMLAMAICCNPALLIADEPTTALDVTVQKGILDLLRQLKEELGLSILFISHDLGVVKHMADRVIIMRDGQIVEQGHTASLLMDAHEPYTRNLLASRPPLHLRLERLPVEQDKPAESYQASGAGHSRQAEAGAPKPVVPLVRCENVSCTFTIRDGWGRQKQEVKAVQEVSYLLEPGETLGLVGESGSGKTTLARCTLGLEAFESGRVYYEGQDLARSDKRLFKAFRKDVQVIFQDPYASLNPKMMIGEALGEPMWVNGLVRSRKERRDKVVHLLETVGLDASHRFRFPHEFSGGQRQRIAIARALAVEPRVIICDECVSSLDVSVQAQILNLLRDLQDQSGMSYLFISHDLSVIRFMCDRVMVMKDGSVVESGSASSIFEDPETAYTRQLLDAVLV